MLQSSLTNLLTTFHAKKDLHLALPASQKTNVINEDNDWGLAVSIEESYNEMNFARAPAPTHTCVMLGLLLVLFLLQNIRIIKKYFFFKKISGTALTAFLFFLT